MQYSMGMLPCEKIDPQAIHKQARRKMITANYSKAQEASDTKVTYQSSEEERSSS
jgi:hypothetical protein